MADTPRSLAALLTILADNTTGDISPQDFRDVVVSLTSYGEIQALTGATQNIAVDTASVIMTGWDTNGLSHQITADQANNKLTVPCDGNYEFSLDLEATLSGTNAVELVVRKNGTTTDIDSLTYTAPAASDVISAHIRGIIALAASDYVQVWHRFDTGVDRTATFGVCRMSLRRVG